jgi:DNA-binding transcriptional ArsR family regulator
MDDKFILMGLDDSRSKDVAEVLGNKTCKKILDFLAEIKEASEKDIADGLKIPINTAEYNLNKLVKSGLVEKSKNFFWSKKGRKIDMYKLAKKYIIISPNKKPDISYIKSILPVVLIALVVVALFLYFNLDNLKITEDNLKMENQEAKVSAAAGPSNEPVIIAGRPAGIKIDARDKILIFIGIILILILVTIVFFLAKNMLSRKNK